MKSLRAPLVLASTACIAWLGACASNVMPRAISDSWSDSGADDTDSSAGGQIDSDAENKGDSKIAGDATALDASGDSFAGPTPPLCDPNTTWASGTLLASSTSSDDTLGAVTPDELTIVWTRAPGGAMEIDWADRASAVDAFGATQSIPVANAASDRVAVSPDGLRVIYVNTDRQGFTELTRATRADAFGAPSADAFANLVAQLGAGESFGDPVVASTDSSFYYSRWGSGATFTIYLAQRIFTTDPWGPGGMIAVPMSLRMTSGMRRKPASLSSDNRTLFYYDEPTGHEMAAWYDETDTVFESFADLGSRLSAQVNADCTRIYYSSAGASSVDLFTAGK